MLEERIEGSLTFNQRTLPFSGFLTINKNTTPFAWSLEIENPSPDVKGMAFDRVRAFFDCCDGSGQGILQMTGPGEVQVQGSGPWTEKI